MREIKIMSDLKSESVVKYFESWVEEDIGLTSDSLPQISKKLYMKMELCSGSLREVIISLKKFKNIYRIFHYFISCELFRELTQCVKYLHSINIIHRDLKPENVLITDGRDGIFLKLCDFNLAKALGIEDETDTKSKKEQKANISLKHTKTTGTVYYIAPEIKTGIYGEKSDIYGLALIVTEIFSFEDNVKEITRLMKKNMYLLIYWDSIFI